MTSFQLVFQGGPGSRHHSEYHRSSFENEPHIGGRPAVDGATYLIDGVEWILRREDIGGEPRFVCTNVVDPTES